MSDQSVNRTNRKSNDKPVTTTYVHPPVPSIIVVSAETLLNDREQQLIVAAWANLVTERGYTVQQISVLMRLLESATFPALMEMRRGVKDE